MRRTDEPPDRDIITAHLAGDPQAFPTLYERYRRPLYSYLNKMMPGQTATVDDIFQQSWIKAVNNLPKYKDKQTFYSWLARIAHNTAIDHFRRESGRQTVDMEDYQFPEERNIPWRDLTNSELGQAIADAVDDLPADQREVFLLRQQDMPFKEIAKIQNCSLNTVLGRMHYAVNKLRQTLRDWR